MPKIIDLEKGEDGAYAPAGERVSKRKTRKKPLKNPPLEFLEGVEIGVRTLLRTKKLFDKLLKEGK